MSDASVNLAFPLTGAAPTGGVPYPDGSSEPLELPLPSREQSTIEVEEQQPDQDELAKTVSEMNKAMESLDQDLRFGIWEDTDQLYVQVIERSSRRIVKTLPSEDMLKLHSRLQDMVGLLLDEEL